MESRIIWTRPFRKGYSPDSPVHTFTTNDHLSCWDCENIRVGGQPNRMCVVFPEKHVWAGYADNEAMELGGKTQADECSEFGICFEYCYLFLWQEEEL